MCVSVVSVVTDSRRLNFVKLCRLVFQESTDDPETKSGGKPGQKLDDDEDRKNPAYIPRKGLFFEHDVRGHAQEEERYELLLFISTVHQSV